MKVKVLNIDGKETGSTVELNDLVFGIEPNDHAIYLDVKQFLANNRQGTHKAKEKGEVNASTKKIKRQKGTGTARAGSVKSPVFVGGGRAFGPRPRSYRFKLNKKLKVLARQSALAYKAKNNNIIILEDFSFDQVKTKNFVELKKNLKISDNKSLLVLSEPNNNVYLSSRNLNGSEVATVLELTTYNIMKSTSLLLTKSTVDVLNEMLVK
ncbi:MAG TPA: 50S ribosomal protein L4 [Bacteroidales bacterium]|nr:MAG: 50S ribosomal protein L4 [Bacteroidetes bacterium GWF2_33_38]OFY76405.1 MAG: 50S ribosomal protein L4 [Bacteroidetes bacterium RIFOXYA12_FULL_33_9]HBF88153.1 50S ribosomal protein L4 [Bacteroidales bacterium]